MLCMLVVYVLSSYVAHTLVAELHSPLARSFRGLLCLLQAVFGPCIVTRPVRGRLEFELGQVRLLSEQWTAVDFYQWTAGCSS